jgi:hypothetical protein
MPYIGNPPAERFTSFAYQDLTGGSGTSFTLDNPVGNPQEIEVFVNNVRQEPGVAYTVSGTGLTMTGSIASTDDFYVVFQGKAIQTATHPSDRALTATDGTFTGDLTVDTSTLHVDAANNRVGVGTTSPSRQLEIFDDGTAGQAVLALTAQNDENSRIMFADPDDNNIGILDYNHSDDSMRFIVNNAERMRLLSGGGLTFNGDTAAANALNDYEEGTVSSISDGSGGGLTYTLYHGRYRKIGDIVNYELDFAFPVTSDTSQNTVTCLPFNPAVHGSGTIGYTTYNAAISVLALDTSNNIKFYNLAGSGLANNSLSNARFIINFTYQTNS